MCTGNPDCSQDCDGCQKAPTMSPEGFKQYREKKGMTQRQFAKAYGMTVNQVRRNEGEDVPLTLFEKVAMLIESLQLRWVMATSR